MWCTRWFLPLLLLPLPTAPPYFLLLFLLSLTIHAKPCFYCVILLTTLFVSSCYWQPFPIDSPLSQPWSDNITTFAEALQASIPHNDRPLPSVMHVVDRCWCDFSAGSFFEPFNISQWEHNSVERFRADLERRREAETAKQDLADENNTGSGLDAGDSANKLTQPTSNIPRTATSGTSPPAEDRTIWFRLRMFTRRQFESLLTPLHESKPSQEEPFSADVLQTVPTQEKLPLLHREYDLRPYGLDLIIDFGWSR